MAKQRDSQHAWQIAAAEKRHKQEAQALGRMERARKELLQAIDVAIDQQLQTEERTEAEQDRPLTLAAVQALKAEEDARKEQLSKNPPPPLPTFTIIAGAELAQRRAERGLQPPRLPVPESVVRARARLEEASRGVPRIRASAGAPGDAKVVTV